MMPMLDGFGHGHDGLDWLYMGLIMLGAWGAIIWGAVWLAGRYFTGPERGRAVPSDADPVTLLRRRYARGEMDQEEFQRRLADLQQSAGAGRSGT